MARVVIPRLLMLRLGALAGTQSRYANVEKVFGPELRKRTHDTREPGVPVSLRWVVNPWLGFPRTPFEVYHRRRDDKEEPTDPVVGTTPRIAPAHVSLPDEVIEIRFDAAPGTGGLRIEALSATGRVLPGQRLELTAAQGARFRAPGIAALRLTGAGSISAIAAIRQTGWARLNDWVLIERVGFPLKPGELPLNAYDPADQGWTGLALDGPKAAEIRLAYAQLLQLDPPAPGGGLTAPSWPFPDAGFAKVLRDGPLADVADCLLNSDDTDPATIQAKHVVSRVLDGIRQPGLAPADAATFDLRTTQYVALAAHDAPVAVGLGLGTIDTPMTAPPYTVKDTLPAGCEIGRDEYLITAMFETPTSKFELAAIGHRTTAPAAFAGVAARQTFANRAPARDAAESIAVTLGWTPHAEPVGAGLLVHAPPAPTDVINTPRPANCGGYQPYLTEYRLGADGLPAGDVQPAVTMPEETIPVSGSAVHSYAAAPIDVHGRWGPWRAITHTLSARAVQKPGVGDVKLDLPAVLPATAPVAGGCTLSCEVSWDWSDRTPDRIELAGAFIPTGPVAETATIPAGQFGVDSAAAPLGVPLTIAFTPGGVPSIAPAAAGAPAAVQALTQAATVTEIKVAGVLPGAPNANDPDQIRRYRVKVPIMSLSFSTAGKLSYAVSARAAEHVRPGTLSESTSPLRVTAVANPFPAPPPALPNVTVLWTAQPDAAGVARTVLAWSPVAGAVGYVVWEATEAALSHAVGGVEVVGALPARAADLKTRVAANTLLSLEAFSRLNERSLAATSIELALPGSADSLFAYRVSSITEHNVESARSPEIVLVGVPRRDVPAIPRLEARANRATAQVALTVIAGGGGPAPAGLRLHRVRRQPLADQIGTMGPPILTAATVALTPVPVPRLSGAAETGWAFIDQVSANWSPYYYRCVAVGRHAPADGVVAGESLPSGVVEVLVAPPVKPLLTLPTRTAGTAGVLLQFTTDLPFAPSPAGAGWLTLASLVGVERQPIARLASAEIAVGPAPAAMGAPVTEVVATRAAAVNGQVAISVLVPAAQAPGTIVLTATDPLARSTSVASEVTP